MGTVRGNMGTVLEHVLLSEAVHWAVERDAESTAPLLYVDTHAMAPLNRAVGNDFNLLESRLRRSGKTTGSAGSAVYSEVFRDTWLRADAQWYPTHFVHAARVANRRNCDVEALLFENDAPDARPRGMPPENRRAEIATFIGDPLAQRAVNISALKASLAAPGDFRDATSWKVASPADARALVLMSDPLEYRPEDDPGGAKLGSADLKRLRDRITSWLTREPDLLVHVIFMSANLGAWDGSPSRATTHLSMAWRTNFAPEGVANWCGACFWGGFLAFIGVAHRGARNALATECEKIEKRTIAALPRLHISGGGSGARWVSG